MNRVTTYGFETAVDHTFSYLGRYLVLGCLPILWIAGEYSSSELAGILITLHLVSVAILIPGTIVINLLALKYARRRTWDRQPWRAWLSGSLGVGLVWGSAFVMSTWNLEAPEFLEHLLGKTSASLVLVVGALLTASAAALATSWLCPPDAPGSR